VPDPIPHSARSFFELLPNTLALRFRPRQKPANRDEVPSAPSLAVHLIERRIDKAGTSPAMDFAPHMWLSCNK
jgi:hypothetical protein